MNKGGKIGKVILWIFAVIGAVIILIVAAAFIFIEKRDAEVSTLTGKMYNDYIASYNAFSDEYSVASPSEVSGSASLIRALEGINRSRPLLENTTAQVRTILAKIRELKETYSDNSDKQEWLTKLETCYQKRERGINLYGEVLNNEEKYFVWYNYTVNGDRVYQDLLLDASSWIKDEAANDKQAIINDLNRIKSKLTQIKSNYENAQNTISFNYMQKWIDWADKYSQVVDLSLQYYAVPSTDLVKQITDKTNDAKKLITEAQSTKGSEEFDAWWTTNVQLKQDEAVRAYNSGGSACDEASNMFGTVWPGNANVVK